MRKKIGIVLASVSLCTLMFSVTAFAGNKDFSFTFKGTSSYASNLGGATKDDNDNYAYVTTKAEWMNGVYSNMYALNARVNTRVRTNDAQHATFLLPLDYGYTRYSVQYQSGKAVAGARYLLYGNVDYADRYPVYLNGTWCP